MRWMLMAVTIGVVGASAAEAQTAGPYTGYVVGHVGIATGDDLEENKLTIGASMAVVEPTGFGAEFDVGHANGSSFRGDVESYMANFTWIMPRGRIQPFVVAGAGALRLRSDAERRTDWGLNGGGGVYVSANETFGVRGDVRYFTTIGDHPDPRRAGGLGFWRISAAGTFSWALVD